jgi:hypothetical protein
MNISIIIGDKLIANSLFANTVCKCYSIGSEFINFGCENDKLFEKFNKNEVAFVLSLNEYFQ